MNPVSAKLNFKKLNLDELRSTGKLLKAAVYNASTQELVVLNKCYSFAPANQDDKTTKH